jgi:hypothetical protein
MTLEERAKFLRLAAGAAAPPVVSRIANARTSLKQLALIASGGSTTTISESVDQSDQQVIKEKQAEEEQERIARDFTKPRRQQTGLPAALGQSLPANPSRSKVERDDPITGPPRAPAPGIIWKLLPDAPRWVDTSWRLRFPCASLF